MHISTYEPKGEMNTGKVEGAKLFLHCALSRTLTFPCCGKRSGWKEMSRYSSAFHPILNRIEKIDETHPNPSKWEKVSHKQTPLSPLFPYLSSFFQLLIYSTIIMFLFLRACHSLSKNLILAISFTICYQFRNQFCFGNR